MVHSMRSPYYSHYSYSTVLCVQAVSSHKEQCLPWVWDDYIWAVSVVESRAYTVYDGGLVMVPIGGMINHAADPSVNSTFHAAMMYLIKSTA